MKIGILSDIHAHYEGLERALDFLHQQAVDEIWCAGDLVDRGEDSNAVIERIRAEKIACVQGNHDYSARHTQEQFKNDLRFMDYFADTPELSPYSEDMLLLAEISVDNLTYLDNLPQFLTFERENLTILMSHANTFDRVTYIYPNSRPALFQEVIDAQSADLIILGHTHKPMKVYQDDKLRIVNSGSVYMNYGNPEQSCAILSLPACEFTLYDLMSLKSVPIPTVRL